MPTASHDVLLSVRNVAKAFGPIQALVGVDFDVAAGEVHALIGENGAGKSTLVKVLSGAHQPDAGTMTLSGCRYAPRGPRASLDLGVAIIYQETTIAPHLSVEDNVLLGREQSRYGLVHHSAQHSIVHEALVQLGHTSIPLDARAGSLPLAARQLVEIARALVSNARVIVFDEPTSVLTERDAAQLFKVIERLKDRHLAIVYISHFLEEVQRIADRYTVLREGRTVAAGCMADATLSGLVSHMIGRTLTEMYPRVPRQAGAPVLEVSGLRGLRLPRHVDLSLRAGEILGIAGLVGAGRTEFLRTLFGLDAVRSGSVRIAGRESTHASPRGRIRQKIGFLSEDRKNEGLALARSIEDNITLPALNAHSRLGWLNLRKRRSAASRWMKQLRIRATGPAQPAATLSGGNQQKVALARLMHQQADILLLDEPTRGIDVGSKVEIYSLIGELAAQGKALIMVSSYLPELIGICDRIGVMRRGVLQDIRPSNQWTEHEIMAAATGA